MTQDEIIEILLKNRGLISPSDISEFFHPTHPKDIKSPFDAAPAIQLIKQHIENKNKIVIFGDYDVDGICSTAILWETLHETTPDVHPYIPHRREDGYGLSQIAVSKVLESGAKLIIAVDCGIVSHDSVKFARSQGCDVIIIDHHESDGTIPDANVVLHSTVTCAAALVWFFCRDFAPYPSLVTDHLSLVALAVICDMVPLIGLNRSIAKYGLIELNKTTRPGLLALFKIANLSFDPSHSSLNTYHCGFLIGPRLNAMGRLENALDSLRLLCTKDPFKAEQLAILLDKTNKERQSLTEIAVEHAIAQIKNIPNLIVVADSSYDEGVIGLIAAKLVEKFHRPSIAISIGEGKAKGSARSIPGFHVTDHLRQFSHLLTGVGGHAMAAGLSLDLSNLDQFVSLVQSPYIQPDLLVKNHRYDLEIQLETIDTSLITRLKSFEPYGLGNPTPTFKTQNAVLSNQRTMGSSNQHLKFQVGSHEAVWFNYALSTSYLALSTADIIFHLGENTWNGRTSLQLLIKHLIY